MAVTRFDTLLSCEVINFEVIIDSSNKNERLNGGFLEATSKGSISELHEADHANTDML